jgi:hypothetical protein
MKRLLRHAIRVFVLLFALAVALAVSGALWLSRRPIELDFLTPRLEEALSTPDGLAVEIGRSVLTVRGRHGLEVLLLDVGVRAGDRELAHLPQVAVDLAGRKLLRGRVVVAGVELEAPAVRVVRGADGRLDVELGGPARDAESASPLDQLVERLGSIEGLSRFRIRNGSLEVEDRALDLRWRAPRTDVAVHRRGDGLTLEADLDVELGGTPGRASAQMDWTGGDTARARATLAGVDLRPVLRALLGTAPGQLPSLPVDGEVESEWVLGDVVHPRSAHFALADARDPRAGGLGLEAEGSLDGDPSQGSLAAELRLRELDVAALGRYWPAELAAGTRAWVLEHIPAGRVSDARVRIAGRVDLLGGNGFEILDVNGVFEAEGLRVHTLEALPTAEEVRASAHFDLGGWRFAVHGARAGEVDVRSGDVSIATPKDADARLEIALDLAAPLAAVVGILTPPPFELLPQFDTDPGRVQGRAQGTLLLGFPLIDTLGPELVEVGAQADLTGAEVHHPATGIDLREGEVHIDVAGGELVVSGDIRVEELPFQGMLRDRYGEGDGIEQIGLSGSVLPEDPLDLQVDLAVDATRDSAGWRRAELHASQGGPRVTTALYESNPEGRTLSIRSGDLGALLDALLEERLLIGGKLQLDASGAPEDPLAGPFELNDFTLRRARLLARLLEALSLTGLRKAFVSEGLRWTRFAGHLAQQDGHIDITEARAVGPQLAVSLEGQVLLDGGQIDVTGSVVPLSDVSRLVKLIPILGSLATGRDDALISAPYRATGTLDDPEIDVDEWSTLIPSALRSLVPKRSPPAAKP